MGRRVKSIHLVLGVMWLATSYRQFAVNLSWYVVFTLKDDVTDCELLIGNNPFL